MGKITAAITGVGLYLPDYILTNEELSTMVDTSDEWIMSHIGVKTRHILKGEGVGTSYICLLYTSPSPRDTERSRMPSSA